MSFSEDEIDKESKSKVALEDLEHLKFLKTILDKIAVRIGNEHNSPLFSTPAPRGRRYFAHAETAVGGIIEMAVNGQIAPVEYFINADPDDDLTIDSLLFESLAKNISIDNFLSQSNPLVNGVIVEVKSEDEVFTFLPIKTTQEFDSHFAWGSGRSFDIILAAGDDSVIARHATQDPFILMKQGTYTTDDYIKVTISDNLSIQNIATLQFLVSGARGSYARNK